MSDLTADPDDELAQLRAQLSSCQEQLADSQLSERRLLQSLRELGTPVMPIHDGILVLPLIGHLDSARGMHLLEDLLQAIQRHRADVVLIDITGVSLVDTTVANSLIQATRAAALLGTRCMMVGVSAAVARTLVQLGIELSQVSTRRDLQAGIELALKERGYAIVRDRPETDWLSEFSEESSTSDEAGAADTPDERAATAPPKTRAPGRGSDGEP
jgi:anti-anti-sigma regulatory factor